MGLNDFDGEYDVTVKGDGTGAYSQKTVSARHKIKNGSITGKDEYGVVHTGKLIPADQDHVKFEIEIDPGENKNIFTTLDNGLLTDGKQTVRGTYKISHHEDKIILTTIENHGGVNAIITCRKV